MPVKFSLTDERRRLESNYNSAEEVFLTLTRQTPLKAAVDHLWYNSGTNFVGSISASTLRDYPSARMFRTFKSLALGLTPTAPFRGALYTYRLSAWVELLGFEVDHQTGQLSVRHAFNMTRKGSKNRSLIGIDEVTANWQASVRSLFKLNQVLFHVSNIDNRATCIFL
jgi:hypothetical protein